MEAHLLKQFGDIIDYCYKDETTILMLRKLPDRPEVTLVEVDSLQQTIRNQVCAPLFEGVRPEEARYSLLHQGERLLLVYPNKIVVAFDQDSFEVRQVVQSAFNIVCPIMAQGKHLVFVDQTPLAVKGAPPPGDTHDNIVVVPIANLEDLAKKKGALSLVKTPFKAGTAHVTDIKDCMADDHLLLLVSFSNGKVWQISATANSVLQQVNTTFSLDMFRDQIGEQKLYQVNCLDYSPNGTILMGDAFGRVSVISQQQNKLRFLYHEQLAYSQIISVRWLAQDPFAFSCISSEGVLTLNRLIKGAKYELVKLLTLPLFEEVANQFNFASLALRQNQTIQLGRGTLSVMWPERIVYKVNKRTGDKKVILEKKLSVLRLAGHPVCVVQGQGVPLGIEDIAKEGETISDANVFFVDKTQVAAYQTYSNAPKTLFNIAETCGFSDLTVTKLDVRPKQREESETYRFLLHVSAPDFEQPMALCFHYDTLKEHLIGNTQQLQGIDSLFLGPLLSQAPPLLSLFDDYKTLQFVGLPVSTVTLLMKVKRVFWTPFASGMAVLYESQSENWLRFSKNRIETNAPLDFSILSQRSFKLNFEERVSAVQWNQEKAAIVTNQRVCIADGNLTSLAQIQCTQLVSQILWIGPTVLYSTERHLNYLAEGSSGTVFALNSGGRPQIPVHVLPDRVVLASPQTDKVSFQVKQVNLLECILTCSLSASQQPDLAAVKRIMPHIQSSASSELLKQLLKHKCLNACKFLAPQVHQVEGKLAIARALGDAQQLMDLLSGSEEALRQEPEYQRGLLIEYYNYFMSIGCLKEAYKCASMLDDETRQTEVLDKIGFVRKAPKSKFERFSIKEENAKQLDADQVPFPVSQQKGSMAVDKELTGVKSLALGYDEQPFSFFAKVLTAPQSLRARPLGTLSSDTLSSWLGYDSLITEINNAPHIVAEEDLPEEHNEKAVCAGYWRCDEGRGTTVADMSDNEANAVVGSCEWELLEDGAPLEYEDKWGKVNTASYGVELDGYTDDCKGFSIELPEQPKARLGKYFTVELWLKVNSAKDGCRIDLFSNGHLSLTLAGLTQIQLICQHKLLGELSLNSNLKLREWHHFAIGVSTKQTQVYIDSQLFGTLPSADPQFANNPTVTMARPFNCSISATELRLWAVPLSESLIKENWRCPLAMLYEQKRAIRIKINKKAGGGLTKPQLGKPGLKMASQFDKKAKVSSEERPAEEEIKEPVSKIEIVKEEPPVSAISSDFDFGFSAAESMPPPTQQTTVEQSGFDFFGGFSSSGPESSQEEQKQDVQIEEPAQQQEKFEFGFDFDRQPAEQPKEEQKIEKPVEEPKPATASPMKISRMKIKTTVTVSQKPQQSLSISSAIDFKCQDKRSPIQVKQPDTKEDLEREREHSQLITDIIALLLASKLTEAERLIDRGFVLCRQELSALSQGGGPTVLKDRLKKDVRAYSTYRLTHKLSLTIAQLKQRQDSPDVLSAVASLSNMLIIMQLPPSPEASLPLKRAFLQFALNQNIKLKNFSAACKIVQFYRKQVPVQDEELAKVDSIEALCKKYGDKNMSGRPGYQGAECPACSEPLLFGHATPQCHKCKAKIGICYLTLQPLVSDKSPKCNLCFAKFAHGSSTNSKICPICQMSKVDGL